MATRCIGRLRADRRCAALLRVWVLLAALQLPLAGAAALVVEPAQSAPAATVRLDIAPAPAGRLPWAVFDERTGLPQHTIVDMLVDQRGFVWAATQDGAARYNGRNWETVPLPRQMNSNYPRAMRAAHDGGLWIGSFDGGLGYLRDGTWQVYDVRNGLPSNRIRGLLETVDGAGPTLWIATDAGVARLRDGRFTAYGQESGLPSLDTEGLLDSVAADGTHSVLVGTSNGLARFAGDRFEPVPVPRQLLGSRIDDIVESTGLHGEPALWIASYGKGMAVLERGQWTVLDTGSGLPSNVEVFAKSAADDGSPALWIGTEGGLLRFEHGRFTLYDERSGLPIRIIWKVLETTAPGGLRTLWLGTWGGGIVRLSSNAWTAFDASVGMPSGSVTSALLTRDERGGDVIWAGTSDGELGRFAGDRFTAVEMPAALRHAIVFSLLETRADDGTRTLWVGSFGGGIGRLQNGRWSVLDPQVLPDAKVYFILETRAADGSSVIWVGTEKGVGRLQHGQWTYFHEADGLPSDIVTQLLETPGADGARSIWAGTSRGIARLVGDRWEAVGKAGSGLISSNISSLQTTTDPDGARWLWAGTFGGGASRLRLDEPDAHWQPLSTQTSPALPSNNVMSVAADNAGRVYLCTTRGVVRLTPRHATAANPDAFGEELFTTEDGLPSGDCQQAARLVDRYGRIWMGTAGGLAMFDPRAERPDLQPKPLLIDRANLADHSRVLHDGDVLSYTERNIEFAAALLAYGGESRIRYRYQLSGFDPAPSEWTAAGVKEYTNLGAGHYTFKVWGRDAHDNVSGPVALTFTVKPAPWLTAWAFAAYALLAMLAVYGAIQWRVRALALRTRELESEVSARTRDLVAARDELARLATEDALTGVANRRKFDMTLDREWRRAQREGHWLTLALIDVDFFKRYNDRYGHAQGDACLRGVAQAVASRCARPTDLAARYGGEEFALVLPETDPLGAEAILRSALQAVDALRIMHADSAAAPHVTISLGAISLQPRHDNEAPAALRRADALLYQAKAAGRHCALLDGGVRGTLAIDAAEARSEPAVAHCIE